MTTDNPCVSCQPRRHITVTASGHVSAVPDTVLISAGVETAAKTSRAALSENSDIMRAVIDRLKELGIGSDQMTTVNLNVHPEYERTDDHRRSPKVTGYRVNNSLRIRMSDVSRLGDILDQVVELGANQIGGIEFTVTDADRLRDAARRQAMANARRCAELLAGEEKAKLGKVLEIQEGGVAFTPQPMAMSMRSAKVASAPIEAGDQDLTATVTVTWELV